MSPFDRTKILALVGAALVTSGQAAQAQEHLVRLIHDPVFGDWSERHVDAELV